MVEGPGVGTVALDLDDALMWDGVPGQPDAVALLRAAVAAPVHAYLVVGPTGAGREELARAFAGGLFAEGVDDPAAAGRHRALAASGRHPDLVAIEPEGRSLLVVDAERITREGWRSPIEARCKVIMVDRFHTAEPAAAASLLKTIEEPPASAVFVLLADEVPEEHVTIASRCVRVDAGPIGAGVLASLLEADGVDSGRAADVAEAAGGSLERARLLATDPAVVARRDAWRSVPERLDGSGAAVAVLVAELRGLIDDAQAPLEARHQQELEELAEREEVVGTRGSGRRELVERQRREVRRHRDDELRFGLATLSRAYLARAQSTTGGNGLPDDLERLLVATARITEATSELVRNPNEPLLLQALLLDLPTGGD
ncbi:MAG: hypothetical protein CL466_01060 [Acidimicrobiaceae bacterium]|nr:hypothetical protein [Acidimicrobiaceae bacterium]